MTESAVHVTLPEMGESVTEGSIVEWRVKPGQWVDQGATLVDVTTDKVDVEVPAPAAGVVVALHAKEGDTVAVGAVLADLDPSAAKPPEQPTTASAGTAPAAPPPASEHPAPPSKVTAPAAPRPNGAAVQATPQARRLAARSHVALDAVPGSGPNGLIVRGDVAKALASAGNGAAVPSRPAQPPALPDGARTTPLKGPAGALAGYMEQSLSVPTATSFRTIGVATLEKKRAELNAALRAAGRAEKVSFTHLIAFALVRAASEMPAMVASFRRDNGTPMRVEAGVNLGIAVDVQRKDGTRSLVVPVIQHADGLDFAALYERYQDLVARARDSRLSADELSGASFTLTNPGGIGTAASVPRLMAGQGAIIATGAIRYPPGFARANDSAMRSLGVEKIMTLTSTYDHRVIQGAQSGEYLRRVEELLAGADHSYEAVFASLGLAPPQADGEIATPGASVVEAAPAQTREPVAYSDEMLRAVAAGMAMLSSYRRHGHLAAKLDPLGRNPGGDPALEAESYGLTPAMMSAVPAAVLRTKLSGDTLADILPKLRETYSSTIAYEVEHIANIEQREWLRDYIEGGTHRIALNAERATKVLERLSKVEAMERFLRKAYIGQKTFSIEGLDVMIPMLEEIITELADDGIETAVIGMAHRGRLSTIAHVVNRPYEEILSEFEAGDVRGAGDESDVTGDVKYHQGSEGTYDTYHGATIHVSLANNPSHLEAVDGVVEGRTRALQTSHGAPIATVDEHRAAPVLIHGDAAFSAQGVVAEVLNLQSLAGYATGGTIHIIANNQVGFTTDPYEARSTRYASDLAKGFDVPIVHVNADDVEACIGAARLAMDFRRRFAHDIIIDLIGYRRFGHNETDEPAYTQPQMYERIKTHPTVRELYAQKLIAQNLLTKESAAALLSAATERIAEAQKNVRHGKLAALVGPVRAPLPNPFEAIGISTGVAASKLAGWSEELVAVPEGFTMHPKLLRQLERREAAFAAHGEVDWGLAEALAFASLVCEGTPVRLSGQDTERGTFSHRHLVLHDPVSGMRYVPLQHFSDAKASFEIYNSPLSEYACLAFEYGYSVQTPSALVLWEAQFGDFMNGGQIVIDQFIAAGNAKWGETSRLVLLLPHGYEGAGPEHSSARIERFLQLSAEGNVLVANCSTASQYFHLLRVQARSARPQPLVVFTPKSLLRLRASYGHAPELVDGRFRPVIDDDRCTQRRAGVERVLLCSGKIYFDLAAHPDFAKLESTAVVRVELLSPLPVDAIIETLSAYPNLKRVVWVQEEPQNMGARAHVRRRIVRRLPNGIADVEYVGRPYRASPSEGYGGAHAVEQERILTEALREP